MNSRSSASVVMVLSHYILKCDVPTKGLRLLDFLNDRNVNFMQVENGTLFRRNDAEPVASSSQTLAVKDNIEMIVLAEETRPGDRELFYATLGKRTVSVIVSLPVSVVEGTLHLKSAKDPNSFLTLEAGAFVPVTNATIHHLSTTTPILKASVVIVNKSAISSLSFAS